MYRNIRGRYRREDDDSQKAYDRQREEENDISVHRWTPQDLELILHSTHIGEILPRVPVVIGDEPHT